MVWVVPIARATFDRCGVVLGGSATLPEAPGRGAYRALGLPAPLGEGCRLDPERSGDLAGVDGPFDHPDPPCRTVGRGRSQASEPVGMELVEKESFELFLGLPG